VRNRLRNGEWAREEEIQLFSKKYDVCLCVWVKETNQWMNSYPNSVSPNHTGVEGCDKLITLILTGKGNGGFVGTHFDALLCNPTPTVSSK
jgi:hypothetical protein